MNLDPLAEVVDDREIDFRFGQQPGSHLSMDLRNRFRSSMRGGGPYGPISVSIAGCHSRLTSENAGFTRIARKVMVPGWRPVRGCGRISLRGVLRRSLREFGIVDFACAPDPASPGCHVERRHPGRVSSVSLFVVTLKFSCFGTGGESAVSPGIPRDHGGYRHPD